jgi:hypothetical protein
MSFIGAFFLVLMGFLVMNGSVLMPVGVNETYQYGNNFTGYHWDYDTGTAPDGPQVDAYLFHVSEELVYEAWSDGNNVFIGFLIVVMSLVLMITVPSGLFGRED